MPKLTRLLFVLFLAFAPTLTFTPTTQAEPFDVVGVNVDTSDVTDVCDIRVDDCWIEDNVCDFEFEDCLDPVVPDPEPSVPVVYPVEPPQPPVVEPEPPVVPEPKPVIEPKPSVFPPLVKEPDVVKPVVKVPVIEPPVVEVKPSILDVDLTQIAPQSLSTEELMLLTDDANNTLDTAVEGSLEYNLALNQLLFVAQADDIVVSEELANVPVLGASIVGLTNAFNALGNFGADMSKKVRHKAKQEVVAAVIVTQIATTAVGLTVSAPLSIRRIK
jgi:hypothetical protein